MWGIGFMAIVMAHKKILTFSAWYPNWSIDSCLYSDGNSSLMSCQALSLGAKNVYRLSVFFSRSIQPLCWAKRLVSLRQKSKSRLINCRDIPLCLSSREYFHTKLIKSSTPHRPTRNSLDQSETAHESKICKNRIGQNLDPFSQKALPLEFLCNSK